MYSCNDWMRAIELRAAAVIRKLGYPNHQTLLHWYEEHLMTGELHSKRKSTPRYSAEQEQAALKFYTEHGRSITYTIKTLGYPSVTLFKIWLDEAFQTAKNVAYLAVRWYNAPKKRSSKLSSICVRGKVQPSPRRKPCIAQQMDETVA